MVRAIATVGYMGYLPRVGGLLAAAFGLILAVGLFVVTQSGPWMVAGWCFVFAATAWALPRAMNSAQVDNSNIVIDRILGMWLVAAPTVPAAVLAWDIGLVALILVLAIPILAFHLILMGPLRRMGESARPWPRLGDDLIAGVLVMILVLGTMVVALPLLSAEVLV